MHLGLTYDDIQILPQYSEIHSRSECSTSSILIDNLNKSIVLTLPIFSAPMDTVTGGTMASALAKRGAMGILHRFMSIEETENELQSNGFCKSQDKINHIGLAIGLTDYKERIKLALDYNVAVICLDTANGHNSNIKPIIQYLKDKQKSHNFLIMAGNVCTKEGAYYLCELGVNLIRTGLGGGAFCSTRIQTGIGLPQATAIMTVRSGIDKYKSDNPNEKRKIWLIADGGIKYPGDLCKALCLSADAVMIGNLFGATEEAPGESLEIEGKIYKHVRGSASKSCKSTTINSNRFIEGVEAFIPCTGSVNSLLDQFEDGLKSCMSYLGYKNFTEFNSCTLIQVSPASQREAYPHILLNQNSKFQ